MGPKSKNSLRLVLAFGLVGASVGCSDSSFRGETPRAEAAIPEIPETRPLNVTCNQTNGTTDFTTDLSGKAVTKVRVEGEICNLPNPPAPTPAPLTVIFVIDFSGSMRTNDPGDNTSCGRLRAAQAIVTKMEQSNSAGIGSVEFGVVSFATRGNVPVPPTNLNAFRASLNASTFCGIMEGNLGGTNYEAAFDSTRQALTGRPVGQKVIYFISDGMPTSGGERLLGSSTPHQAGLNAANRLRSEILNVTLNAILVGDGTLDPSSSPGTMLPKPYLEQITGSPDKVRLVTSADQIAAEIVTFVTPTVTTVTLDSTTASATLTVPGMGSRPVNVASLTQDPARPGVWHFASEPFELYSTTGQISNNEVLFRVRASDGTERTARVTIRFRQEP